MRASLVRQARLLISAWFWLVSAAVCSAAVGGGFFAGRSKMSGGGDPAPLLDGAALAALGEDVGLVVLCLQDAVQLSSVRAGDRAG